MSDGTEQNDRLTERIADLTSFARVLDREASTLAEDLHRAQVSQEAEVRRFIRRVPEGTPAEELVRWYEDSGINELRMICRAIVQRLGAVIDEERPPGTPSTPDDDQREKFHRYGLDGFGIDPYDEHLAASTGMTP